MNPSLPIVPMRRLFLLVLAGAGLAPGLMTGPVAAKPQGEIPAGASLVAALNGTTWCAPRAHTRVAVDRTGAVVTKEGKEVCLVFKQAAGQLVTQIIWWNLKAGLHVHEWAIALPTGVGQLSYVEAAHPPDAQFPGIEGLGEIRLGRDGMLEMDQIGHIADGSAAAFSTRLARVKSLPAISLSRTYPAP